MKKPGKITITFGDYSTGLDYKKMAQEMRNDIVAIEETFDAKMSEECLLKYHDTKVGRWEKTYPAFDKEKLYLAIDSVVNSKRN